MKVTQVVNGERNDLLLCQGCAQMIGVDSMSAERPDEITQNILDTIQEHQRELEEMPDMSCSDCGLHLKAFLEKGLLGCPHCYSEFEIFLKPLIRRYHGTTRHFRPSQRHPSASLREFSIHLLRDKLNNALKTEDFETAAKLRDEIRAFDKSQK